MSNDVYEKCGNTGHTEGARPYKCRDYPSKMSTNLHHFKRDGRFCDIDLISGSTKVKVLLSHIYHHSYVILTVMYVQTNQDLMFCRRIGWCWQLAVHISMPCSVLVCRKVRKDMFPSQVFHQIFFH